MKPSEAGKLSLCKYILASGPLWRCGFPNTPIKGEYDTPCDQKDWEGCVCNKRLNREEVLQAAKNSGQLPKLGQGASHVQMGADAAGTTGKSFTIEIELCAERPDEAGKTYTVVVDRKPMRNPEENAKWVKSRLSREEAGPYHPEDWFQSPAGAALPWMRYKVVLIEYEFVGDRPKTKFTELR